MISLGKLGANIAVRLIYLTPIVGRAQSNHSDGVGKYPRV